jgi:hypothetical protein
MAARWRSTRAFSKSPLRASPEQKLYPSQRAETRGACQRLELRQVAAQREGAVEANALAGDFDELIRDYGVGMHFVLLAVRLRS